MPHEAVSAVLSRKTNLPFKCTATISWLNTAGVGRSASRGDTLEVGISTG